MRARDGVTGLAGPAHAGADRALARPPAEHEQARAGLGVDHQRRDVARDPVDLRGPQLGHPRVVGGVIGDVAGHVGLLEAADPVRQPGRPGNRPRPRQALVAGVRHELLALARHRERGIDRRQIGDDRHPPRLRGRGQERVGQKDHRRPVADRDLHRLERRVKAPTRGARRDHRHRRLAVAAVHRHQQIRLLGLRRHPRRGAGALHVDHDHRQLERRRQPDRLGLQVHPRPARRGHAEAPAERRSESHPRRGDLVLGLNRLDAELRVARELVQQLGRRRDRIARKQKPQTAPGARRDQPQRQRGRAVDVAVCARRDVRRRLDLILDVEQLGRLAERPSRVERRQVREQHAGLRANFCSIHFLVTSVGRPYSHDSTPSANRFLARPASRVEASSTPSTAAPSATSSGSGARGYALNDPSSSGFERTRPSPGCAC